MTDYCDDNCCGQRFTINQFGEFFSGITHEQAPYSYVLVQVVLVWKRHFQILNMDIFGSLCKTPLMI